MPSEPYLSAFKHARLILPHIKEIQRDLSKLSRELPSDEKNEKFCRHFLCLFGMKLSP